MPASVLDTVRDRVLVIHQSIDGECGIRQLHQLSSTSWSAAECINWTAPPKLSKNLSPGPGTGLQLASGRLLFAIHSSFQHAMVIISDDGGEHWQTSAMPPSADGGDTGASLPGSECQMARAMNGSVLLNCRAWPEQDPSLPGRLVSVSNDGGRSFASPWLDRRLWGANSADGFARGGGQDKLLYFSGPRNNNTQCPWCRTHMAVLASGTDGASWSAPVSVWRSESAYSVLLGLQGGGVGLLYERGDTADHYHNITFARISRHALPHKTDDNLGDVGRPASVFYRFEQSSKLRADSAGGAKTFISRRRRITSNHPHNRRCHRQPTAVSGWQVC